MLRPVRADRDPLCAFPVPPPPSLRSNAQPSLQAQTERSDSRTFRPLPRSRSGFRAAGARCYFETSQLRSPVRAASSPAATRPAQHPAPLVPPSGRGQCAVVRRKMAGARAHKQPVGRRAAPLRPRPPNTPQDSSTREESLHWLVHSTELAGFEHCSAGRCCAVRAVRGGAYPLACRAVRSAACVQRLARLLLPADHLRQRINTQGSRSVGCEVWRQRHSSFWRGHGVVATCLLWVQEIPGSSPGVPPSF